MKYCVHRTRAPELEELSCDVTGQSNFDTVMHTFSTPAYVMSSIDCDPEHALKEAQFSISDANETVLSRETPQPDPYDVELPAGQYRIQAAFAQRNYANTVLDQLMQPPFTPCTLEVSQ